MRSYFVLTLFAYTGLTVFFLMPATCEAADWAAQAQLPNGRVVAIEVEMFWLKPGFQATQIKPSGTTFSVPTSCSKRESIYIKPKQDGRYNEASWPCKEGVFKPELITVRREIATDLKK